jgi:sigma-B regulation protein RsbU (phosphoserine phosphatase)
MESSIPVGVREVMIHAAGRIALAPGQGLFLYTDGVTEAENGREELFGEERLVAALRKAAGGAPEQVVRSILGEVRSFAEAAPPSDDIAMVACRWRADSVGTA